MPATVVKQSNNPQTHNYKAASRGPQQPILSVPNIQRKRNAQGQLRNENDLQAAPAMTSGGTPLLALENVHGCHSSHNGAMFMTIAAS